MADIKETPGLKPEPVPGSPKEQSSPSPTETSTSDTQSPSSAERSISAPQTPSPKSNQLQEAPAEETGQSPIPIAEIDPSIISSKLKTPSDEADSSSRSPNSHHSEMNQESKGEGKSPKTLSAAAEIFTPSAEVFVPSIVVARTPVYDKSVAAREAAAAELARAVVIPVPEEDNRSEEMKKLDELACEAKRRRDLAELAARSESSNLVTASTATTNITISVPQPIPTIEAPFPTKPSILSGTKIKALQSTPEWQAKPPTERLQLNSNCAFASCEDMRAHIPALASSELIDWAQMVENSMIAASTDSLLKKAELEKQTETIFLLHAEILNFRCVLAENTPTHINDFRGLVLQLKDEFLRGNKIAYDPMVLQLMERIRRWEDFETTRCAVHIGILTKRLKEVYEEAKGAQAECVILKGRLEDAIKQLAERDEEISTLKASVQSLSAEKTALQQAVETKNHALKQSQKESARHREKLKKEIEGLEKELFIVLMKREASDETREQTDKADTISEKGDKKSSTNIEDDTFATKAAQQPVPTTPTQPAPKSEKFAVQDPTQEPSSPEGFTRTPSSPSSSHTTSSTTTTSPTTTIPLTLSLENTNRDISMLRENLARQTRKHHEDRESLLSKIQSQNDKLDTVTSEMKHLRKTIEDVNLDRNRLRREKEQLENKVRSLEAASKGESSSRHASSMIRKGKKKTNGKGKEVTASENENESENGNGNESNSPASENVSSSDPEPDTQRKEEGQEKKKKEKEEEKGVQRGRLPNVWNMSFVAFILIAHVLARLEAMAKQG